MVLLIQNNHKIHYWF